jgi:hypothetical protein
MPWIAFHKPPRRRPGRLMRWREAHRERFGVWIAGGVGLVILLGFWFAVAHTAAAR